MFNEDVRDYYGIPDGDHVYNKEAAHEASLKNKESILRSEVCGCFSCLKIFPASEAYFVKETDGKETAWCPYCDMDAVLGDASGYPITPEFLKEMQNKWF